MVHFWKGFVLVETLTEKMWWKTWGKNYPVPLVKSLPNYSGVKSWSVQSEESGNGRLLSMKDAIYKAMCHWACTPFQSNIAIDIIIVVGEQKVAVRWGIKYTLLRRIIYKSLLTMDDLLVSRIG